MGFFPVIKAPMAGLLLVLAYTTFILSVVMVSDVEEFYGTYPPAVVSLMVCAIVQMLFLMAQFAWGRSKIFTAFNILIATAIFACWNFGSIVPTTVLRHHGQYCFPMDNENGTRCAGVLRGTEGLGWALFGGDLIYMVMLVALVSSTHSKWSEPIRNIPKPEALPVDLEKAPQH